MLNQISFKGGSTSWVLCHLTQAVFKQEVPGEAAVGSFKHPEEPPVEQNLNNQMPL